MIEVYERLGLGFAGRVNQQLVLTHDQRERGRLRAFAEDGEEVRLFLERGKTLAIGEFLRGRCGKVLQVAGATEPVMTALCDDWHTFSRACYHLGNRHVKLQVGQCWLRITPDHVLAEMLQGLGLSVREEEAVFVPESGAYSHGAGHHHHHDHDHEDKASDKVTHLHEHTH
ncbi:urease accessory protein UreE [Parahaliea maris]|uniref:Urease accessory protein UreE n=1 Tax=Parahaliea maris TaxID=2716870 RepID=A0A5C9A4S3_9GAMM|nr:urease accessory protein UreE [Parahaliea maris]TXS95726.1 urease accessory protein UreE [Parahaliea maris]